MNYHFKLECKIPQNNLGTVCMLVKGLVGDVMITPLDEPPMGLSLPNPEDIAKAAPRSFEDTIYGALKELSNGKMEFTPRAVRHAMRRAGYSPASYSYGVNKLIQKEMIERTGKGLYRFTNTNQQGDSK